MAKPTEEDCKRPFHCGSQMADWKAQNCDTCAKGWTEESGWRCDIEKAIDHGYMGNGSVPAEIGRRMGVPDNPCVFTWPCPEHRQPNGPEPEKIDYARLEAAGQGRLFQP